MGDFVETQPGPPINTHPSRLQSTVCHAVAPRNGNNPLSALLSGAVPACIAPLLRVHSSLGRPYGFRNGTCTINISTTLLLYILYRISKKRMAFAADTLDTPVRRGMETKKHSPRLQSGNFLNGL